MDRTRKFLQQQGNSQISLSPEITLPEARQLIGAAFGGKTPDKGEEFMVGTVLEPLGVNSLDQESTKDRQELSAFCLGFFCHELFQKGGMALGIRKHGGDNLQAVVVFREYDTAKEKRYPKVVKKIVGFVRIVRAYLAMKHDSVGLPSILSDKQKEKIFEESSKKFSILETHMEEGHTQHGPKGPHWYVGIVASDPESQGQGYCKQAMTVLTQAADEAGMPCYLECSDAKRAYYEKFGFELTKRNIIRLGEGEELLEFPMCLMTRPCKAAHSLD
jgi:N-acetylglutamate synthase-like GNAT family acetyltransferase